MELITGYQEEDHVTSMQDAMWHRGIWKDDCIISVGENLKAEVISNNEIRVRSGILNMQGKFCSIDMNTYDSLNINNGTAGENRIDLIVARYEKNNETQVEDVSLKVIQGTPSTATPSVPSYVEGNIDNGDLVAELPVFQVNIEGINITNVDVLLKIIPAFTNLSQPLLFDGAIKTGNITLTDSIFNYKFLIIQMASDSSGITFGTAMVPIQQIPPASQTILFTNVAELQTHSTYMGRCVYSTNSPNVMNITVPINNVVHTSGENHGGGSTYFVRQIYGVK